MKQPASFKTETVREMKIRHIKMLKAKYGSSPLIDQLEREVSEDSQPKEIRVVGTVAPKK